MDRVIRPATSDDEPAVAELAVANAMFAVDEVDGLTSVFRQAICGGSRARVLLVETSSTEQYHRARAFYLARGFDEEARVRDFYGPGDDRVVFWKSLTA